MRVIALAGYTGTGKTALLRRLAAIGEATVDLEALARHHGSAFGATEHAQPTHAEFEARVSAAFRAPPTDRPLWLEDSPPFLGSVGLPAAVQAALATAPVVEVTASHARRCAHLVAEYGATPTPRLLAALDRIRPRLGDARADAVRAAVLGGSLADAAAILLAYYDAAYDHRVARWTRPVLARVDATVDAADLVAGVERAAASSPMACGGAPSDPP